MFTRHATFLHGLSPEGEHTARRIHGGIEDIRVLVLTNQIAAKRLIKSVARISDQAQVFQAELHTRRSTVRQRIKQDIRRVIVAQRLRPNFHAVVLLRELFAHGAQFVLINGNQILVLEDFFEPGVDCAQVSRHYEWRGHYGPEGHLGARLSITQTEIADDEHVGVVPAAGSVHKR